MYRIMLADDEGTVIDELEAIIELVDVARQKQSNELAEKEMLESVMPLIESGLIYNILFQEHFEEDIGNYKSILGIKQSYAYMLVLVCGEEQEGNHMIGAVGSSVTLQRHYREVRECLKECLPCMVGTVMTNKLAVLVLQEQNEMEYKERIELIDRVRGLIRRLGKKLDARFRIGIGSVKGFGEMGISYSEALNSLVFSTGSVVHAEDCPFCCEYEGDYPIELERRLFVAIGNGEWNQAVTLAKRFFGWMEERHSGRLMDIRLKVLEFALWAEHLAYERGGVPNQFNLRTDYLPEIMGMSELCQLKDWFVEKIMDASQNILHKRVEKSNRIIEQAEKYISTHYSKNISLKDVSRMVDISPYYFSKIFKEYTGKNFVEYLTGIRMEKAKELLIASRYSMKEIGSMVGYLDPNYFSRSFKKNVGVTPTEYKECQEKGDS